jgi:hypothetical protein
MLATRNLRAPKAPPPRRPAVRVSLRASSVPGAVLYFCPGCATLPAPSWPRTRASAPQAPAANRLLAGWLLFQGSAALSYLLTTLAQAL